MNDTKTQHPGEGRKPSGDELLCREVRALLDCKDGIDESKAKRLRKQWEARQSEGQTEGQSEGKTENQTNHTPDALFVELRERVHKQVELRAKQFAEVEEKLVQLRACLENGDVKRSQKLDQAVVAGLNRIAGLSSSRHQTIITGLEELRPKLRELDSWRRWSTTQAREKIIKEIKQIHESGATLVQIAQRIQQARKEWKQWAGEGGEHKLYAAFDRACTEAYRPCHAHFEQRKQQSRENIHNREQICALLEQEFEQVEWRDPPWKKLRQLVQAQTSRWRASGEASYKLRKPLQQRFNSIVGKFNEPMERERERNRKLRESLITSVEQLAERVDAVAAHRELQALKKRWIPTVTSSRGMEQALWNRFTRACDNVREKQERERKEFNHALKQNLVAGEALCAEIEASCRGESQDCAAIQGNLGKWKERWEASGEKPKASAEKIATRYRNAITEARKALAKAAADEKMRTLELLREKSLVCAGIEALALADSKNAAREAQHKDWKQRWESLTPLPDELESAIAERYQLASEALVNTNALKQLSDSLPGNLEAVHERLLQLEILAELDSPAEFARLRMAMQVARLSAALGKAGVGERQSAEALIRDILLSGAVDEARRVAAFERLDCCLRVVIPQSQ